MGLSFLTFGAKKFFCSGVKNSYFCELGILTFGG